MTVALKVIDIFHRFCTLAKEKHEEIIMIPILMAHASMRNTALNKFREDIDVGPSFVLFHDKVT